MIIRLLIETQAVLGGALDVASRAAVLYAGQARRQQAGNSPVARRERGASVVNSDSQPTYDVDSQWLHELKIKNTQKATKTLTPSRPDPSSQPVVVTPAEEGTSVDPSRNRERFLKDPAWTDDTLSAPALVSSRVPSSRLGRLFHYGGLAAGLGWGAASEAVRRSTTRQDASASDDEAGKSIPLMLSESNVRRLVGKLSQMRGAALKIGQFMSIQDAKVLPPQLENVFLQVQNSANYMPKWQAEQVMTNELGIDWRNRFGDFSEIPFAAASIGQVHKASPVNTSDDAGHCPSEVAVKIQFPGVYESISSDLSYLSALLFSSALLPKGLFLESTMTVLGKELRDECNYKREAWALRAFGAFLEQDPHFYVPKVVDELSTGMVLTTEYMHGTPLTRARQWPQKLRDQIGHDILKLCLREILHFQLMQTDPNWTNFLWNWDTQRIELLDFGATREYSDDFVSLYLALLQAAIEDNRDTCIDLSRQLGYLTGQESEVMIAAHVASLTALGEPFRPVVGGYPFATQTVTDRVRAQVPVMLQHRLTPPPRETYSLNRKLSGAFLLCSRLGSNIDCSSMMAEVVSERPRWMGAKGLRSQRLALVVGV